MSVKITRSNLGFTIPAGVARKAAGLVTQSANTIRLPSTTFRLPTTFRPSSAGQAAAQGLLKRLPTAPPTNPNLLRLGVEGPLVATLQARLQAHGYFDLARRGLPARQQLSFREEQDGKFGNSTLLAVRAWQRDRNLPNTGQVDLSDPKQKAAFEALAAPAAIPSTTYSKAKATVAQTAASLPPQGQRPILRLNSTGPMVSTVQAILASNGYGEIVAKAVTAGSDFKVGAARDPSGTFGPATDAAVRAMQRDHGLNPDGTLDLNEKRVTQVLDTLFKQGTASGGTVGVPAAELPPVVAAEPPELPPEQPPSAEQPPGSKPSEPKPAAPGLVVGPSVVLPPPPGGGNSGEGDQQGSEPPPEVRIVSEPFWKRRVAGIPVWGIGAVAGVGLLLVLSRRR